MLYMTLCHWFFLTTQNRLMSCHIPCAFLDWRRRFFRYKEPLWTFYEVHFWLKIKAWRHMWIHVLPFMLCSIHRGLPIDSWKIIIWMSQTVLIIFSIRPYWHGKATRWAYFTSARTCLLVQSMLAFVVEYVLVVALVVDIDRKKCYNVHLASYLLLVWETPWLVAALPPRSKLDVCPYLTN